MSDDGLYERTITTYKLNSGVDLSDTNKILSMSKEEIEKLLSIKNIKKIRKSILDPDDDLYLNDALILTNNFISDENVALKQETVGQNFVSIIIYMIAVLTWGYNLKNFKEKLLKNKVKNRIAIIEQQYQEITDIDLYSMKVVLELQKENLAMLDLDEKNIDQDSNNQYKLRKV